jgi:D-galactarolactone cycloisomerase
MNRRELLCSAGRFAAAGISTSHFLQPVKAIAADVKRVRIQNIEAFALQLPRPTSEAPAPPARGFNADPYRLVCTRVTTDAGVRGYSFVGGSTADVEQAKKVMTGENLFAVEQHLSRGLINWSPIEEAVWDAIGRIAGQPVHRLLGGAKAETLQVYLTYVWPGAADQTDVTPKQQAEQAAIVKKAGFRAMKIRIFRPNYMDDVEACSEILATGGPGFRTMVDRTATAPGLWTYPQGLAAAQALQKAGVYWLEEPFDRNDFEGPARLAREVDILITGGEGYRGLAAYRECLMHGTYDILQPDCNGVGGILTLRKVGALCQAWGVPICPHASSGLALAGRVQASAAMGSMYQEIGVLTPPQLPNDRITPVMPILNSAPFVFREGELVVPQGPGLGLDLNEEAINRFRVEGPVTGRGGRGGTVAPPTGGRGGRAQ